MARVMSLVFMIFMLVPVLAPNIGQAILLFAPWRAIFVVLAGYALIMLAWSWIRLPETLHPEYRRSLAWREIARRDRGDRPRAPVARLHAGDDDQLRRPGRLHLLDPADRVRRLRRGPQLIGLVFACDRRADGPRLLAQFAGRRPFRAAAGRAHAPRSHSRSSPPSMPASRSPGRDPPVFIVLQGLTMAASPSPRRTSARWRWSIWRAIAGTASSVQGVIGTLGAAIDRFRHRPGSSTGPAALPARHGGCAALGFCSSS